MYNWRDDIKYVAGSLYSDNKLFLQRSDVNDIINAVATLMVEENGLDSYIDPDVAIEEETEEFTNGGSMTIWAVPCSSELYELLIEWYGDFDTMCEQVRNALYLPEYDCLFFITGMGYDIMSADLLGGTADGIAARDFDRFVAEHQ